MAPPQRWINVTDPGWTFCRSLPHVTAWFTEYCAIVVRRMVWMFAVRPCEAAIQYRNGMGTNTTHWRVGTLGITRSTKWAAVWAMRRPAHDGQNPRRLPLKARSTSFLQVSQPSRRKPWARMPHCLGLLALPIRPQGAQRCAASAAAVGGSVNAAAPEQTIAGELIAFQALCCLALDMTFWLPQTAAVWAQVEGQER